MSMVGPVLAQSDSRGRLHLDPETAVKFVMLMAEGIVDQSLIVCKEGYEPNRVVRRSGWNADFDAGKLHEIPRVELAKSIAVESSGCRVAP